ncbi:MAG: hypothetical protein CM1200mP13_09570 [Candidatus Pelagibacterales bacterium]|nr:MAG: hypothetical protein CM1200mP13_09570 [Pelagibacterales bacterium]
MNMDQEEAFGEFTIYLIKKKFHLLFLDLGMALERNKEVCSAIKKANYEVASHGWDGLIIKIIKEKRKE